MLVDALVYSSSQLFEMAIFYKITFLSIMSASLVALNMISQVQPLDSTGSFPEPCNTQSVFISLNRFGDEKVVVQFVVSVTPTY